MKELKLAQTEQHHSPSRVKERVKWLTYTHPAPYRRRVSQLRRMLSKDQAETDGPHGHAGDPQPYLQHGEHQEAPDDVAAGAHPGLVIVPVRLAPKATHSPPPPQTFVSSSAATRERQQQAAPGRAPPSHSSAGRRPQNESPPGLRIPSASPANESGSGFLWTPGGSGGTSAGRSGLMKAPRRAVRGAERLLQASPTHSRSVSRHLLITRLS